ncbi:hypothetical protein Bbelb_233650 [Branchiostoma belcheri]|nr:hypothetical protein Bbelb_233650 [Branchiostoma belcheri]
MPDLWTVFVFLSFEFALSGQSTAVEIPGYVSLGCWKDAGDRAIPLLEGTDPRLDGQYGERENAIGKCFQVAVSRGFPVFSVQHGGQCFGSADGLSTYMKHGPSSDCAADGKGAAWANQVYQITAGYRSLGCWADTDVRAIPTLEGTDPRLDGGYQQRNDSVEKCYQVALSRGFAVFAVQNGGWCAGSDTASQGYSKYGPSTACGRDGEGGPWANQVYEIILTGGSRCENRSTDGQYVYRWNLTAIDSSSLFTFEVQANNDAHVALSSQNQDLDDMYEIVIGGWDNTRSAIRRSKQGANRAVSSTPGVLSSTESRGFWISWTVTGSISVGRQGEAHPFLEWTDPQPLHVAYAGYTTGWGSTGQWRFCPSLMLPLTGCENRSTDDQYVFRWNLTAIDSLSLFTFEVQANNDAHVALSSQNQDLDDMYIIVIGSWNNTGSAIRRSNQGDDRAFSSTPGILSSTESRGFWISWTATGSISVGRQGEAHPFLEWTDPQPLHVAYAGYTTGWGSTGQWRFCPSLSEVVISVVEVEPSASSEDPPSYANASSEDPPPPSYEDALNMPKGRGQPAARPPSRPAPATPATPRNQHNVNTNGLTTSVSLQDLASDSSSLWSLRLSNSLNDVRADTVSMTGIDNTGAVYDEPPSYPEVSTSVVQVHPSSSEDPPSYDNASSEDPPPPSYEDALNMA